jgi:hypothetical protein
VMTPVMSAAWRIDPAQKNPMARREIYFLINKISFAFKKFSQ